MTPPTRHDARPVGRRTVGFACAAVFVVLSGGLAIVKFSDGAWVQGALWTVSTVIVAVAYGSSLTHRRRP